MGRIYDATWGRGFAALYDRAFAASEAAGLRELRREALAGANLELYPAAVTDLVLAEPDPHMLKQLRVKARESGADAEVTDASAEALPYEPASFDTAIFTLVLCTVPNPERALSEVARVLKPGGRLLFLEHVRGEDGLARWQDRLERPWRFLGDGCHCNRDTVAKIEASPLTVEQVEPGELPKAPPIVRPLVRGSAILRG
jgi:SAM-dependent methyltransferase